MKSPSFERALEKAKQAAERKEARLRKRLELAKGKAKRPSIALLKKKLWTITSKIVRHKAVSCYTCGRVGSLSAGHFWPKGSHPAAAFSMDNLRPQGNCCNLYRSGNLAEYSVRLRAELGEEKFEALNYLAHSEKKWSREELESLIVERLEILRKLEDNKSSL